MKSDAVEATSAPTLTWEEPKKVMPESLRMKTRPLAFSAPRSSLGTPPMTRLMAIAEVLGWKKLTDSLTWVEKVCQSMSRRWVAWSMLVAVPSWVIVPPPEVTTPPVGWARATPAQASAVAL